MNDKNKVFRPVGNLSLLRLTLERIEESLLSRQLKPGDWLPPQGELCNMLGVSRSTVREALRMLEAIGIVKTVRGKGTYIPEKPSGENLNPLIFSFLLESSSSEDIFEFRAVIEPVLTALAAQKATEEDFNRLRKILTDLKEALNKKYPTDELAKKDMAFHKAIFACCKNPYLEKIGVVALKLFRNSIARSITIDPLSAITDHENILKAMESKDASKIHNVVLSILEGWKKRAFET
ncbi:FadR/GntR family transcriptional regulator [Atrimonas thermophila]|uniref:FadR/GntR family transcriptional regulator n=1 Tax=Atrimonas thermophila TaxID=3064161 RepID=UPI00399C4B94